jgi:hypothetical protein
MASMDKWDTTITGIGTTNTAITMIVTKGIATTAIVH